LMIRVTRQIKCLIAQAQGGSYPTPYLKWTFYWLRSPPLNHIYLWSGWIDKLNAPRVETWGHPHPLPDVFLRITHVSETILSILTKLCPNVPWVILFQSCVRKNIWFGGGDLNH
jgi:hypothetical protein